LQSLFLHSALAGQSLFEKCGIRSCTCRALALIKIWVRKLGIPLHTIRKLTIKGIADLFVIEYRVDIPLVLVLVLLFNLLDKFTRVYTIRVAAIAGSNSSRTAYLILKRPLLKLSLPILYGNKLICITIYRQLLFINLSSILLLD
jgi:hypothetical protein